MSVEDVPERLPKKLVPLDGSIDVTIKSIRISPNPITTTLGTSQKPLLLRIMYEGVEYSYMFSLDKTPVTGSPAKILAKCGVKDVSDVEQANKLLAKAKGITLKVTNRAGKFSWS